MKALIIILALVGVSFVALLVYGGARSEQPKRECERVSNLNSKDGPGEDDLKDWCPPKLADATKPLQARFAPDLGIDPVMLSASGLGTASFQVAGSKKKMRAAHVELVAGEYAILKGSGDNKLCLCRAGPMSEKLFGERCPDRWKDAHLRPEKGMLPRVCSPDDVRGILPFEESGGSIDLLEGPSAKLKIE
jgi:hypothetical protein